MNILKSIRSIIPNDKITFVIWGSKIYFYIYETEVPIIINTKTKEVYLDCESANTKITSDMLYELHSIVERIEGHLDELLNIIE